jgi:rRNA maturation protein Nop10
MSGARQVKRCPQCGTMTFKETAVCQTCGHEFRSEAGVPQPTYNPERTQMLTLPAAMLRSAHEAQAQQNQQESSIQFIEPTMPKPISRLRVILLPILIVLLLVGLFFWLAH